LARSTCFEVPSYLNFAMPPAQLARGCDRNGAVMTSRQENIGVQGPARIARATVAIYALCLVSLALAQDASSPSADPNGSAATSPSQTPTSQNPTNQNPTGGFSLIPPPPLLPNLGVPPGIETFGRWLEPSTTRFKSDLQGAQETFDKLGTQTLDAAKDATGAVVALPSARIVTARERCAAAQNGSVDCQAAAELLCRGKGFQTGRSLDTQSELKCPAKLLLERRAPNDKDCPTETFVTRAMCQ
jgi:hypothetical protein